MRCEFHILVLFRWTPTPRLPKQTNKHARAYKHALVNIRRFQYWAAFCVTAGNRSESYEWNEVAHAQQQPTPN